MVVFRTVAMVSAVVALIVIGTIAVVFQDNISRFAMNPRTPYQLYEPPPQPDYTDRDAWSVWPDDPASERRKADVFYIHSTTYASKNQWNAPLTDKEANQILRSVAAPNEIGPFYDLGAVYGPRYRQATRFASFTHKFDGLAARQLAYQDVSKAFELFLKQRQDGRPMVIVGYEQGGLHALGLLQQYIAKDDSLRRQLAAAYIIGAATPLSIFDHGLAPIPPCRKPDQTGCVVAFIDIEPGLEDEKRRLRRRALIWEADGSLTPATATPHLCTNPLTWDTGPERADPAKHIGAASATGLRLGETPPPIPQLLGAACVNGILAVDRPKRQFLRRSRWFGGKWRTKDFNLFYHDLAANGALRIEQTAAALQTLEDDFASTRPPVDIEAQPTDKRPQ